MTDLNATTRARIRDLCKRGDRLIKEGRIEDSLDPFWTAWGMLPEPKTSWEAAAYIMAAVSDVNFCMEDYEECRVNLETALRCPGAVGNPYFHLRLGQCEYELGDMDRAGDELARARVLGGAKIFEDEDPKYLKYALSQLRPPSRGR
jgi:hypothetical protein